MRDSGSYFEDHIGAHQRVVDDSARLGEAIEAAGLAIVEALVAGRKLVSFGNGGSATQASHLAGELVGRFRDDRRALPAISLASDAGSVTCISNDFGYAAVFERQVEALVADGDIAVGLSTSGKSENVLRGLSAAQAKGAVTVALTGASGLASGSADHLIAVPSRVTAHVQEIHLMAIHAWCARIDAAFRS